MVAKGTKRKLTEQEVVAERCDELAKVITDAANLPASVVKMLADVMPHCLGQPKDKRHHYQEEAILAVERVIQNIEETFKFTIDDNRSKVAEAKHMAKPSEDAVEEAEKTLQENSERFDRETKTLAEVALAFRTARNAVQKAEEMQQTGNEDFTASSKKKAKLQVIIDDVEPLKKGDVPEADLEKRCKSLLSALKQLEFDEAMLLVLDSSLKKAPSVRGQFDDMAIDQLDKYMAKHVEPLDEVINAGEAGRQERAAAVASAKEAFEEALKAQRLAAESFESAMNAKKDSETSLQASKEAVRDLAAQTKTCDKALYKAEAESDVFQEFARKTFEELKDRTAPEPVEPTPEPVEPISESVEPEAADSMNEDLKLENAVILPEAITA